AARKGFLRSRAEVEACERTQLRAGLLQRDGAVSLPGTALSAKEGATILRESAVSLFACGDSKLGAVPETGDSPGHGARRLSLICRAGFSGERREVQVSEQSRRAGGAVHVANAL